MEKKRKQWIKLAVIGLVLGLCGCGSGQEERTLKEIAVEPSSSAAETSAAETFRVQEESSSEAVQKTTEQEETIKEETLETTEKESLSGLEEKWNTYWADGEFTFEETADILREAGYWEEDGFYKDSYGHLVDLGLTYDFIQQGSVFQKQEDGSFVLVSALEDSFGDVDSSEIDAQIRSYGYEIEYNNDEPYVYDGKGNSYSYKELAAFLLEGETIPYAPQKEITAVSEYVEYLKGDWVSEGGSQIQIREDNGKVFLDCDRSRADGSKIVVVCAELEVHADGSFIGYYADDPWRNSGTVYGTYIEETGQLDLTITVDVDGGYGWSNQMDEFCFRKYEMSFEDFVSVAAAAFEEGYTWYNDSGENIDIWGNGTYYYIDMYYIENGAFTAYELDTRLYQDEYGIYFNISDSYCYGKVYLCFCADEIGNLYMFTKMEIPVLDNGYYMQSNYASFFDGKLYRLQ